METHDKRSLYLLFLVALVAISALGALRYLDLKQVSVTKMPVMS